MSLYVFHCSECQQSKLQYNSDNFGSTGYGIDKAGLPVCFDCCGKRDKADMIETGRAILYLSFEESFTPAGIPYGKIAIISNWPGTLRFKGGFKMGRHNIAGKRYDIWFHGPDGKTWHGVTYGDNTQICHCRRLKGK